MSGNRPGKKKQHQKKKPVDPAVAAAKRERRAQAAADREAHKRKVRRKRMLIQIGIVTAVTVVVAGIAYAVIKSRTPDYAAPPAGFDDDGGITVGNPDATVTVTMVEDFACPHCATKHDETKELFAEYAAGDDVRIDYQPIAALDSRSSDDYSSRALNAAACVVGDDERNWSTVHDRLMANQPSLGSGLSDRQLADLAADAGAESDSVGSCIADRDHQDWIDYTTHRAKAGDDFAGTPAAYVDGERVDVDAAAIQAAVEDALER